MAEKELKSDSGESTIKMGLGLASVKLLIGLILFTRYCAYIHYIPQCDIESLTLYAGCLIIAALMFHVISILFVFFPAILLNLNTHLVARNIVIKIKSIYDGNVIDSFGKGEVKFLGLARGDDKKGLYGYLLLYWYTFSSPVEEGILNTVIQRYWLDKSHIISWILMILGGLGIAAVYTYLRAERNKPAFFVLLCATCLSLLQPIIIIWTFPIVFFPLQSDTNYYLLIEEALFGGFLSVINAFTIHGFSVESKAKFVMFGYMLFLMLSVVDPQMYIYIFKELGLGSIDGYYIITDKEHAKIARSLHFVSHKLPNGQFAISKLRLLSCLGTTFVFSNPPPKNPELESFSGLGFYEEKPILFIINKNAVTDFGIVSPNVDPFGFSSEDFAIKRNGTTLSFALFSVDDYSGVPSVWFIDGNQTTIQPLSDWVNGSDEWKILGPPTEQQSLEGQVLGSFNDTQSYLAVLYKTRFGLPLVFEKKSIQDFLEHNNKLTVRDIDINKP